MSSTDNEGIGNINQAEIFSKIPIVHVIQQHREKCESHKTKGKLCGEKLLLILLVTVDLTHHWVTAAVCQGKRTVLNGVYTSVDVV